MRVLSSPFRTAVRSAHFLKGHEIYKSGKLLDGNYFDDKVLLLYFSASWCKSCKLLTPHVKRVYDDVIKEGLPLEMLWVSRDRDQETLLSYYDRALPPVAHYNFGDTKIQELLTKYEVKTIPALRLVDSEGKVVSDNIRRPIEMSEEGDGKKLFSDWQKMLKN